MKQKILHSDLHDQIVTSLKKGENIQLYGLKGMGKSRLLRDMEENQTDDLIIYRSDFGLISDRSVYSILKFIFGSILGFEKIRKLDQGGLSGEVQKYFNDIKKENKKVILLLDSFDKLTPDANTISVFNFLSTLHSQFHGNIGFVFGVDNPLTLENSGNIYGDLGKLLFGKTINTTPLDKEESLKFINTQEADCKGLKLTGEDKNKIIEASGGFMFVIKRLIQGIYAGEKLEEMITKPSIFPALSYSCELVIDQIKNNRQLYGDYKCMVLENYINLKLNDVKVNIEDRLTASEYKIFKFLKRSRGQICTRDEIITKVWGESSDTSISDHALDQIISRLRNKLNNFSDQRIQTIRGRGHKLLE